LKVIIAIGHGGIYSGGSHQSLYALAALKDAGIEVMAIWGDDIASDPRGFDRLKALQIPFKLLPINHRATFKSISQVRRIIKDFQPEVIECVKGKAQHHVLLASMGLPKHAIVYYRGVSQKLDFTQGLRYRLPRVDRLIANCKALKQTMVVSGKINPAKVDVVYGEFDPACSDPELVEASDLRNELGIHKDVTLITQLGNWASWRGQDITIHAVSALHKKGHNIHLLFAGRDTDKLIPIINDNKASSYITASPYRRDPERVLKITDIIVNSSTRLESLSGALINAQTMGIPAVTSAVSGSVEIVEDGVTGIVVPPNDTAKLTQALESLLLINEAQFKLMKEASRQKALKLFSPESRVQRRLECYRKAIEHRRG